MEARKITIEPVTRIEGHGRVTIHLDEEGHDGLGLLALVAGHDQLGFVVVFALDGIAHQEIFADGLVGIVDLVVEDERRSVAAVEVEGQRLHLDAVFHKDIFFFSRALESRQQL